MQFAAPGFLAAGAAAIVALVWLFHRGTRRRREALARFAAAPLLARLTDSVSPARRRMKQIFLVVGTAAMFAALARPQVGFSWQEVKRRGIDILMAVDTSRSMLATDVTPNRLTRARLGILDFVSRLDGDRVGLVPFSGSAFLMCPLTLDYDAFRRSLDALDETVIPLGGTDLASAIRTAEDAFENDANHKILVLITDGEDLEGEAIQAARTAAEHGVTLYTVGVGTPGGELIPLARPDGGTDFVKDAEGRVVKSRLDEGTLKKLAEITGGAYEPFGQQAEGLDAIYQKKLSLVPKGELMSRMRKQPIDRYEWPLALALLLLVLEFALGDRRPARSRVRPAVTTAARRPTRKVAAAGLAMLLLATAPAYADGSPGDAEAAYKKGDFKQARKVYEEVAKAQPDQAELKFNLGAASYKAGDYAAAATAFQNALQTESLGLQNQAYYNLGNTLFRQGESELQQSPQATIQAWEKALQNYDGALQLVPEDQDARFNRELVKKKLEELKKQQQQKQNQQKQNQQNKEDQKNQKNQKNKEGKQKQQNKDQQNKEGKQNQKNQKNDQNKQNKDQQNKEGKQNQQNQDQKNKSGQEPQKGGDSKSKQDEQRDPKRKEEQKGGGKDSTDKQKNDPQKNQDRKDRRADSGKGDPKHEPGKARRKPGQMTPEEARRLLDSLKGDDGDMPVTPQDPHRGTPTADRNRRDW